MAKSTLKILQDLQAMPLIQKVILTKARIREWVEEYGEDGVYVSFSGGKDSTVLLHLVRSIYPNLQAVFCDTGLELPEIREFVRTFDNVEWLKPKKTFIQVIEDDGYPLISKEVSECVQGARKYLTALIERENAASEQSRAEQSRAEQSRAAFECLPDGRHPGHSEARQGQRESRLSAAEDGDHP